MKTTPLLALALLTACNTAAPFADTGDTSAAAFRMAEDASDRLAQPQVDLRTPELALPPLDALLDHDQPTLTISWDHGGDGVIDKIEETLFGADNRRYQLRTDRDADGLWDEITTFAYEWNDAGQLVNTLSDTGADGTVDKIETRIYTVDGRLAETRHDEDADGTPDRIDANEWDSNGRRVRMTMDTAVDRAGAETVQDFTFDAQGRNAERLLVRLVGDKEHVVHYRNVFNDQGRVEATEIDLEADGVVDNVIRKVFDDRGRAVESHSDTGNDGTIDTVTRNIYDATGRLVEISIDSGNDGSPNTRILRDYKNFAPQNDCLTR